MNADTIMRARGGAALTRRWAYDVACFGAVVACAAIVAWMAAYPFLGHVPDQNAFYSADVGRVYAYLSGNTEGYYRMKVHPLYGWLCIVYQTIAIKLLHVPPWIGIPLLSSTISVGSCGLLYVLMRRLGVKPFSAAAFVLLFCSSATFVFWSTLPETHMLAGATVVLAVLLMTSPTVSRNGTFKSAVALAIGFSVVVTDGMIWVLRQIDFLPLRRGAIGEFWRSNLTRLRPTARTAVIGIGLVYLLWSPEWPILGKRVGIPFNFLEERNFVEVGTSSAALTIHIFGLTPPQIPFAWVIPALCIGLTVAALWLLRPKLWFIPLFALFGLVLHLVYSGDCAFLFSPDYMPMFILTLALVAKERLPNWISGVVIAVALVLLPLNLEEWHRQMEGLRTAGQLMTFDTVTLH